MNNNNAIDNDNTLNNLTSNKKILLKLLDNNLNLFRNSIEFISSIQSDNEIEIVKMACNKKMMVNPTTIAEYELTYFNHKTFEYLIGRYDIQLESTVYQWCYITENFENNKAKVGSIIFARFVNYMLFTNQKEYMSGASSLIRYHPNISSRSKDRKKYINDIMDMKNIYMCIYILQRNNFHISNCAKILEDFAIENCDNIIA
jgi:hypothetical protein